MTMPRWQPATILHDLHMVALFHAVRPRDVRISSQVKLCALIVQSTLFGRIEAEASWIEDVTREHRMWGPCWLRSVAARHARHKALALVFLHEPDRMCVSGKVASAFQVLAAFRWH
eukprot:5778725-Prymnesium_polylepis.1